MRATPVPDLPELDPIIHAKLRLAVLALLAGVERADFAWLRDKTGSTDGNIGAHLAKLEEAKYINVEKKFQDNKPLSLYRMTPLGRKALSSYIEALKQLLGNAI